MPGDRRWNKTGKTKNRFPRLLNDCPGGIDFRLFFRLSYDVLAEDAFLSVFAHWRNIGPWSQLMEQAGFSLRTPIIWNKRCANGGNLNDALISVAEYVIRASKGEPDSYPLFNPNGALKNRVVNVWDYGRTPKAEYCGHPTQKPLHICEQLIRMATAKGDLVVDPFCGAGSTLVAAKTLGRRYAGCDVDAKFVRMAIQRMR
jgi:site-specific DNA-methyltransferase (adenine-specific)